MMMMMVDTRASPICPCYGMATKVIWTETARRNWVRCIHCDCGEFDMVHEGGERGKRRGCGN